MKSNDELKGLLAEKSLRVTEPRLEILKVLKTCSKPVTIAEIHSKIKNRKIDLATVYRTINSFLEHKLITDIDFKDEFKRYELIHDRHHHHHVVCRECKKIEDLEFCFSHEIEKLLSKKGYSEVTHSIEFFGVCGDCRKHKHNQ
jgi:Fe2+ or Zn2+ uptake regulation protein